MKAHYLKTYPEYFSALKNGKKNFELRFNDRDFKVNDILILEEYIPQNDFRTGEIIVKQIDYVLKDISGFGLQDGFAVLGLRCFKTNCLSTIEQCLEFIEDNLLKNTLVNAQKNNEIVRPFINKTAKQQVVKYLALKIYEAVNVSSKSAIKIINTTEQENGKFINSKF